MFPYSGLAALIGTPSQPSLISSSSHGIEFPIALLLQCHLNRMTNAVEHQEEANVLRPLPFNVNTESPLDMVLARMISPHHDPCNSRLSQLNRSNDDCIFHCNVTAHRLRPVAQVPSG